MTVDLHRVMHVRHLQSQKEKLTQNCMCMYSLRLIIIGDNIPQIKGISLEGTIFIIVIPLTGTVFLKHRGHEVFAYPQWRREILQFLP